MSYASGGSLVVAIEQKQHAQRSVRRKRTAGMAPIVGLPLPASTWPWSSILDLLYLRKRALLSLDHHLAVATT